MSSQLVIKDKIEVERLIKVAAFKKGVRNTSPHKHNNYFEVIYLSSGSGYHYIDLNKFAITPPVVFFVRQEQVHYWDMSSEPNGYVVIIRKSFIERSLDNELKLLLSKSSSQCCLLLSDNRTIEILLALLTEESKTNGENSFQITEGLLKSLLAKIFEVAKPMINKAEHKPDLFHSFIDLLSADNGIKNKVAHYAKKLNTTPQNINAVCQKSVQKPATEVLSEYVLIEAKRLLLYTDKTVSEISFALEFTDPSHFVKYFKKMVGCTPQTFRQANS